MYLYLKLQDRHIPAAPSKNEWKQTESQLRKITSRDRTLQTHFIYYYYYYILLFLHVLEVLS